MQEVIGLRALSKDVLVLLWAVHPLLFDTHFISGFGSMLGD